MTGTTDDRLLGGRVVLRQPESGYRAAIDPVFLAAFCPAAPGDRVLDVGCGVGAASLCLAARVPGVRVTGLDIQPGLVALAAENARASGLDDRAAFVCADLLSAPVEIGDGAFAHVVANPPFLPPGSFTPPADPSRAVAHGEGAADLSAWIAFAHRKLRRKGSLTLVHRADRVDDVMAALRGRFGEVVLFALWPKPGQPAKRILVRARKDVAAPARIPPGLVLHHPDGSFTREADAVLRDGAALTA